MTQSTPLSAHETELTQAQTIAGPAPAQDAESASSSSPEIHLLEHVDCPHCWHRFKPEQVLWVAQHEDLMHDPVLGDEPLRFLPTRFTLDGQAIDPRGMVCHQIVCPRCHLVIPRLLLENQTTFLSIIGSVGSGKSNFLAAMTWDLRQRLPRQFGLIFGDADKESNWILNRYEETLFLPDDPDRPVMLEKTRAQGDLYRSLRIDGQETQLPKPFLFSLHPSRGEGGSQVPTPDSQHRTHHSQLTLPGIVCLYDNAGEHYGVGQDTALTPVTRHLSRARVLMFLFDPTQDPRFRQKCRNVSHDPQVTESLQTVRQETFLTEAAIRIRRHRGLSAHQRCDNPLLVLVAKSDIWAPLIEEDITHEPIIEDPGLRPPAVVDLDRIERVSAALRSLLVEIVPELVSSAEDFWSQVRYIPVSALGHSPEKDPAKPGLYVRPRVVQPHWVSVPLLYSYARWSDGPIRRGSARMD